MKVIRNAYLDQRLFVESVNLKQAVEVRTSKNAIGLEPLTAIVVGSVIYSLHEAIIVGLARNKKLKKQVENKLSYELGRPFKVEGVRQCNNKEYAGIVGVFAEKIGIKNG